MVASAVAPCLTRCCASDLLACVCAGSVAARVARPGGSAGAGSSEFEQQPGGLDYYELAQQQQSQQQPPEQQPQEAAVAKASSNAGKGFMAAILELPLRLAATTAQTNDRYLSRRKRKRWWRRNKTRWPRVSR